jgi:pimeloyl-ACP methyl ester carboxylesterase
VVEESGSTDSGDGLLAWRRLGAGRPAVLLNGYGATKEDWDPAFVAQLAAEASVLCPDNRGLGASVRGGGELTVARLAQDVLTVMDDVGIEHAAVIGWSLGGFIAQELAARAPERVEALVLLATDPGGPEAVRSAPEVDRRLRDHTGTPREQATRLIGLLFPPPVAVEIDARFGEVVAAARERLAPAVLEEQERLMDAWHRQPATERLVEIRAPTLVAAGTADVVIPPQNVGVLAAHLPDAWTARFPGGGHAFMAQEPKRLAGLIRTFLG